MNGIAFYLGFVTAVILIAPVIVYLVSPDDVRSTVADFSKWWRR